MTVAILDFVQDVLSGLNVREYYYLEDVKAPACRPGCEYCYQENGQKNWEDFQDGLLITVSVYDDGLDYDEEGNAYWDDYPGYHEHSSHATHYDAQAEAAWLEHAGIAAHRIMIQ